ncbi:MAG TPA: hypothetical protein VLM85_26870 [Polyangiaceae bacterium]|nr:hypothetical protein [Polyangiaceae bacterium]
MNRGVLAVFGLAMCVSGALAFGACGSTGGNNADGGGGDGTLTNDGPSPDAQNFPCDGCGPFPPPSAPQCSPQVLGPAKLAYPTDGLLLPPNMNVLEVQFVPPQGAVEYEVDFENSITDVRVTTFCDAVPDVRGGPSKGCGLTLPQAAWNAIANQNRDGDPVVITVRATIDGSCVTTSQETVRVSFAKDDLAGGIYYWQSATYGGIGGKTGGIYSHDFGTFDPTPTPFYTSGSTGTCVGCHNVARDGMRMALAIDDPDGDDEFGDVHTLVMDIPTRTKVGGTNMSPGFQTFTHDHSRMVASTFKTNQDKAFAIFDGNGATLLATAMLPSGMYGTQPDLSKDDQSLVFVVPGKTTNNATTISSAGDHHFVGGSLYTASFDGTANTIGTPQALLAATGTQNFYYPSFAPSLNFVVFNEADDASAANNTNDAFYNRKARVKIMHYPPQQGDAPLDLAALNVADGLSNSWPRWSPFVGTYKGHKLLWVTFSSNRDYGLHLVNTGFDNCYPPESPLYDQPQPLSKQNTTYANCAQPQIWMAGVIVDDDRGLDKGDRSFPAFWLPFQDVNSHNHSAQWVEKIVSSPPDAGPCVSTAGGACGPSNLCCTDYVCCNGTCQGACVN